jgi:hypothetical protein
MSRCGKILREEELSLASDSMHFARDAPEMEHSNAWERKLLGIVAATGVGVGTGGAIGLAVAAYLGLDFQGPVGIGAAIGIIVRVGRNSHRSVLTMPIQPR